MRFISTAVVFSLIATSAYAEAPQKRPAGASRSERINVESIREKYWAKGEESDLRVVQNRLYSKERKFELGLFVGSISTDPFLNVRNAGGTLAFHLSEYFALGFVGWRAFVNPSSALETFEAESRTTVNTNHPQSFMGGELVFSPIYGKLSLVGKLIIYYDLHLMGGAGLTKTESGSYTTPLLGIGQQIYIAKYASLRLDYRMTYYKETILQKVDPLTRGQPVSRRSNTSGVLTLGLTFLLNPFN